MERCQVPGQSKYLILPNAVAKAHLARQVITAVALQKHDVKVAFANSTEHGLLKQLNVRIFPIPDGIVTDFSSNVFAVYTPTLIEQCIQAELEAINQFQPDAIIGDFRLTAAISAKLAGVPYISVVNGYMTDYFDPVEAMIPKTTRPMQHAIASLAASAIQYKQKRDLARPFRDVARRHGIKSLRSLYDFLTGDLTLIADLPEFCPLEKLPESFRYIGPLIWEGINEQVPAYLEELDPKKIVIYATTGNTGKRLLIDLVIAAFRDDPAYEVVITTGAYIDPRIFPKANNIHIESFIPGSAILKRAHVAIHCGGNGTVYQTLKAGVPAIVVAFNTDQLINAWLVKKHQIGVPVSAPDFTVETLRSLVKEVPRNATIQQNVQRFKRLVSDSDGAKSAADAIMRFLSNQ